MGIISSLRRTHAPLEKEPCDMACSAASWGTCRIWRYKTSNGKIIIGITMFLHQESEANRRTTWASPPSGSPCEKEESTGIIGLHSPRARDITMAYLVRLCKRRLDLKP